MTRCNLRVYSLIGCGREQLLTNTQESKVTTNNELTHIINYIHAEQLIRSKYWLLLFYGLQKPLPQLKEECRINGKILKKKEKFTTTIAFILVHSLYYACIRLVGQPAARGLWWLVKTGSRVPLLDTSAGSWGDKHWLNCEFTVQNQWASHN
jgi:hypothetical protein